MKIKEGQSETVKAVMGQDYAVKGTWNSQECVDNVMRHVTRPVDDERESLQVQREVRFKSA